LATPKSLTAAIAVKECSEVWDELCANGEKETRGNLARLYVRSSVQVTSSTFAWLADPGFSSTPILIKYRCDKGRASAQPS
jgi:hypothetical protein